MDRRHFPTVRSLPRVFLPGAEPEEGAFSLPKDEYDKLHRVLRLGSGDPVAILPNDGTLWVCHLRGHNAICHEQITLATESERKITLMQALPKGDKLDNILAAGTELGVAKFVLFPSDRTVVRWDAEKIVSKQRRLEAIVRESCELSFRVRLPEILWLDSLAECLQQQPKAIVLSERDDAPLLAPIHGDATIVVGPEGGWSPREVEQIGNRAWSLGPRVLRVETAAIAACALALGPDR